MTLLDDKQMIRGTYEVERFLGEGAFAEVYRVKHRFLGRQAMKIFKMIGMTVEETERLLGEAIILSRIGHRNIVRVFDANVMDTPKGPRGYFTMEYVAGGTLERFWQSHGNRFVPIDIAVDLMRQVCQGLALAHSENPPIIHRDIKPLNILIGYDATGLRAQLSDFGLAKQVNPLTLMATAMGTRGFKPPEIFSNPCSDSCAADVWAMGSTLYLLLTDRLPLSMLENVESIPLDRPLIIPPSRLNLQVDPMLDQIVCRALAFKPEERYPSAKELLEDLSKWRPRSATGSVPIKTTGPGTTKSILGDYSRPNEEQAREMAMRACKLARQANKLTEAADLMEEALNKSPDLREDYEGKLKLWRRGIVM